MSQGGWNLQQRRWNTFSLQLSQVQQYADNLRAVQHEHRNLISTIAGLLFLKRYNQALELIQQQSESHQNLAINAISQPPGRLVDGRVFSDGDMERDFLSSRMITTGISHNRTDPGNLLDNAYLSLRQPGFKTANLSFTEMIIEMARMRH